MATPILLTVDDDPQVLNAVERDLRKHFEGAVRIVKAGSGEGALDAVRKIKARGQPLFLILADQRMPGMSGTDLLKQAMEIVPTARKALLTAYADTQAAIASINEIGLDHYFMKPWDPPEQYLFPYLDDLLESWTREVKPPYDGVRVAGMLWSASSHRIRDFLARNRVSYQWIDLDRDASFRATVNALGEGVRLPVVYFPDGELLQDPDRNALAAKLGMKTIAKEVFYDMAVVGAGPAGLAAAMYGASEGLRTVLVEKDATGGQAGTSSKIENYLGFPKGLSGGELAERATIQAKRFGVEILVPQEVVGLRVEQPYKILTLADGTEIRSYAVVAATGVDVRLLETPGAEALTGAGVYYGATLMEAAYYRGEHVFVVGGANSAGQGAMSFALHASKVTMLVRGPDLKSSMSAYLVDQIANEPAIEVWAHTFLKEVRGEGRLSSLVLDREGEVVEVPAAALFVYIGAAPHTAFLDGLVVRDDKGYIVTGPDLGMRALGWMLEREPYLFETNVPGIFAAGDVRAGSSKRVAAAVGEGAVTVRLVHQYLMTV